MKGLFRLRSELGIFMKKNNISPVSLHTSPEHHTTDLEIIDLENTGNAPAQPDMEQSEAEDEWQDNETEESPRKGIYKFFNIHVIFLLLVVVIVCIIFVRIKNWGVTVDLDEIFKDGPGTYEDNLDSLLPLLDEERNIIHAEEPLNILAFGNAPFADDRDSEDGLANIIEEMTGATVYNCAVSNSYLAANDEDMDMFSLYWLIQLVHSDKIDHYYTEVKESLGDAYPDDADEVIETLSNIDLNEIDVVTIMYDATDYLLGHNMYSDENSTDIYQFTGNLEAGIELLQNNYPHIRIIVMSPTYAYAVDKNGNYISSDQFVYNDQDVLSTYVIKQYASCSARSVSFIDHLYNTITEDNADNYLIDNLHLNVAGRKLIAERFEYFLNYYDKGYAETK